MAVSCVPPQDICDSDNDCRNDFFEHGQIPPVKIKIPPKSCDFGGFAWCHYYDICLIILIIISPTIKLRVKARQPVASFLYLKAEAVRMGG